MFQLCTYSLILGMNVNKYYEGCYDSSVHVNSDQTIIYKNVVYKQKCLNKIPIFNYLMFFNPFLFGDPKRVAGKHCRPRSDAAQRGV